MKKLGALCSVALLAAALAGCAAGTDPTAPEAVIDNSPPQAPTGLAVGFNGSNTRILEWTPNSEPDLSGYQVYQYSPDPGRDNSYLLVGTVGAGTTEWQLPVPGSVEVTWLRLRAVDVSGNRSAPSTAARILLGPPSPGVDDPADDIDPRRR